MATRVLAEGAQVFRRSISRDFASGTGNEPFSGLAMALFDCRPNFLWGAVSEHGDRIQIPQQKLSGAHLLAGLGNWRERVQIHAFTSQPTHFAKEQPGVPTNMQTDFCAEGMNPL